MQHKFHFLFRLAALIAVVSMVLVACAPAATPTQAPAPTKAAEPTKAAVEPTKAAAEPTKAPTVAPTKAPEPTKAAAATKIRVFAQNQSRKYPDGVDVNNNPWIALMEKENNIDLDWVLSPIARDEFVTKLNLEMTGGTPADMVFMSTEDVAYYVKQGALQPLDDLIAKYAPSLKKNLADDAYWYGARVNGKIYGLPWTSDQKAQTTVLYIRQDWLDKVNMKAPKTLDEWTALMKAFRDAKLGGDGTVGMTAMPITASAGVLGSGWKLDPFVGAFGTMNGYWLEKDGKLVYGTVQPEMKEALAYLRKLYADKLLDNEWAVQQPAQYEQKIVSGKVGIYGGNWYDETTTQSNVVKNDPKAKWVAVDLPVGPTGKSGVAGDKGSTSFYTIPVTSKNAIEILKLWEWYSQKRVWDILNLGFEGQHYKMDGGKYTPNNDLQQADVYRRQIMLYMVPPADMNYYGGRGITLPERIQRTSSQPAYFNQFKAASTAAMIKSGADLNKLEAEALTAIVTGTKPLEYFDQFVTDWKAKGGDQITKEVNDWFATQKK